MKRLDLALVELGLAPTRSKAQQLIDAGDVEIFIRGEWQAAKQSSQIVTDPSAEVIRVRDNTEILKYVSRGGLKLEGALAHLQLDVHGWRCLDLGLSTGGFTDCLLKSGAAEVCGVDVGHGQLHSSLTENPRLKSFEGVNVKELKNHPEVRAWLKHGADLCVADLSFISLLSVLPEISGTLPPGSRFLGLVKPQFEVGAAHLNKSGIVKDPAQFEAVEHKAREAFTGANLPLQQYFPSSLKGQDGNQEFFAYALRK